MVLPPGLTSGVRGPDARTLTDIYNVLVQVRDALVSPTQGLPYISSRLNLTANALVRLAGVGSPPPGWQGLPEAFTNVIGLEILSANGAGTISNEAFFTRITLEALKEALFGVGVIDPDSRIQQMLAAILAIQTNSAGQLTASEAMALVLGTISGPPTGSTIKDLLRSIDVNAARSADCCEESNGGGTFTPVAPTVACDGRTTTWIEAPLVLRYDNGTYAVYTPEWPIVPEANGNRALYSRFAESSSSGEGAKYVLVAQAADEFSSRTINACVQWHFSPSTELLSFTDNNSVDADNLVVFNSAVVPQIITNQSGRDVSWTSYNTSLNKPGGFVCNFVFPTGTVPDGKVWVASGEPVAS